MHILITVVYHNFSGFMFLIYINVVHTSLIDFPLLHIYIANNLNNTSFLGIAVSQI